MIMDRTPDFFAPQPRARNRDPATSHAAAASMRACVGHQAGRILYALKHGGPGTCWDISARCVGLDHVAIARRLPELEQGGYARPTGEERPGPNGRACRVWEATGA